MNFFGIVNQTTSAFDVLENGVSTPIGNYDSGNRRGCVTGTAAEKRRADGAIVYRYIRREA